MTTSLVAVVEDDAAQAAILADLLTSEGFTPRICPSAQAALHCLATDAPVLVLLDLGLPDADGFAFAAKLRALYTIPIIILTGRGAEFDRVIGLEVGADDYLVKPYSLRELTARIRALLRRSTPAPQPAPPEITEGYRFEGWTMDTRRRRLLDPAGRVVSLTVGEFDLFAALLAAKGRILSRTQLLDMTRRSHDAVYERTIDALILRLRRKIEANPAQPRLIVTERALGYIFAAPVEVVIRN